MGVSLDAEGWDAVTPFLTGVEVNYRVVIGDDQTAARFGVTALPTTFLIDRGGRIAALHEGLTSKKDLAEGVTRLLKTP